MTGKGWRWFKAVVILLVIASLVCAFMLSQYNDFLFWVMLAVISLISIVYLLSFSSSEKNLYAFMSDMETQINLAASEALFRFPSPAVIVDGEGRIIWTNDYFIDRIGGDELFGTDIRRIVDIDFEALAGKKDTVTQYDTECYRIRALTIEKQDTDGNYITDLTIIYMQDITELYDLRANRTRIVMIMVDNLDDLLSDSKESDRGDVIRSIDQLVEDFAEAHMGIFRKTGSDRYFVLISDEQIEKLTEEKFVPLIDKAHEITVGENSFVTLSVGISDEGHQLAEGERVAKRALEMSQRRGGDQVTIKSGENDFKFFGGNTEGREKNSKIKVREFAADLQDLMEKSDMVVIMGHNKSDLDAVGTAAGLAGAARTLGVNAFVYADQDPNSPGFTDAMPIIDRLRAHLMRDTDLFITEDDALLKFTENSLLVIVDTSNREKLDSRSLYERAKALHRLVYIDHHREAETGIEEPLILLHEPTASSAAEMVTEVIQYFSPVPVMESYYADALLSGITLDTKNFSQKTDVRTFEAAAYLRKIGADTIAVKQLFADSTETQISRAKFIASAYVYKEIYAISKTDDPDIHNINIAASQAADTLLGTVGIKASFAMLPTKKGVKISARTFTGSGINVQLIMEGLKRPGTSDSGGGHLTMAAAELVSVTIPQAEKMLLAKIDELEEKPDEQPQPEEQTDE